jgi:hypothetical protein
MIRAVPEPSDASGGAIATETPDAQDDAYMHELQARYAVYRAELAEDVDDPEQGQQCRELLAGDPDELFEAFAIAELMQESSGPTPAVKRWTVVAGLCVLTAWIALVWSVL